MSFVCTFYWIFNLNFYNILNWTFANTMVNGDKKAIDFYNKISGTVLLEQCLMISKYYV